jgi:hypothetical protein
VQVSAPEIRTYLLYFFFLRELVLASSLLILILMHRADFDKIMHFFHIQEGSRVLIGCSVGLYDVGADIQATMQGRGVEKMELSIP